MHQNIAVKFRQFCWINPKPDVFLNNGSSQEGSCLSTQKVVSGFDSGWYYLDVFYIKNGPFPGLFYLYIRLLQLTVNVKYKFCQRLDSKCGPLVSEATALPTEPKPLPKYLVWFCCKKNIYLFLQRSRFFSIKIG